jgi:hypothetical protein
MFIVRVHRYIEQFPERFPFYFLPRKAERLPAHPDVFPVLCKIPFQGVLGAFFYHAQQKIYQALVVWQKV